MVIYSSPMNADGRHNVLFLLCRSLWTVAVVVGAAMAMTLEQSYSNARTVRLLQGHEAALPLYQELLRQNPTDVTAATRIASHPDTPKRHGRLAGDVAMNKFSKEELQSFTARLLQWNFTPLGIAHHIFSTSHENFVAARASTAPLYVQPLRAGSPAPPAPQSALDTCIQLFLMAVGVRRSICQQYLGQETVELLEELGIAFCNDEIDNSQTDPLVVPYCHIMPVKPMSGVNDLKVLYFATDLHPNVLSMTSMIDEENDPVMYIGPDSLALVDHWTSLPHRHQTTEKKTLRIVDIGTGSGIQALTMALSLQSARLKRYDDDNGIQVVCIDLNPRALRIAWLNFVWNGVFEPESVLGDVRDECGTQLMLLRDDPLEMSKKKSWSEWLGRPTFLLANPPFLPVPVHDTIIQRRHGLFSSGGASGEEILQRIVQLAADCLDDDDDQYSTLAIVSEFMNPQTDFIARLKTWWGNNNTRARGVLFTNEKALDAATYALRRADSPEEVETWMKHLLREEITHISPGLLFLQKSSSSYNTAATTLHGDGGGLHMHSYLVPKSAEGSIWTPTNLKAREFSRTKLIELGMYYHHSNVI